MRFASDLTIDGFVGNMMKNTTRTGLNQIDRVEADQLMAVYEPGKSTESSSPAPLMAMDACAHRPVGPS